MIIGTGIDIVEIARFDRFVKENNLPLLERLFTPREYGYCTARKLSAQHFALRFAAKESFLKALGTGLRDGLGWLEIEVVNDDLGKPALELSGKAAEYFVSRGGGSCHLSLSHDAGCAIAMVVLEGKMKAVSAEVMQKLDRRAIEEYGIPGIELMERAGAQAAAIIAERFGGSIGPVALILVGKGNNGGDGLVIARLLALRGWRVEVVLFAAAAALSGDAKANYERLPQTVSLSVMDGHSLDRLAEGCRQATVIVDALFGTGLKDGLSGLVAEAATIVNFSGRPVVAVDIPSGVDASSGRVPGVAVKAQLTVTFAAAKLGHLLYPGAGFTGELLVSDIGIPSSLLAAAPGVTFLDEPHAATLLQPRSRTAHKGSNGHALIIAGSVGKSGAAAMAANSAMRSGAGLVTLAAPGAVHGILELKTTEVMTVPLADCKAGSIGYDAIEEILTLAGGKSVMAVGPGVGTAAETASVVRSVVASSPLPLVIDADGLNAVAADLAVIDGVAAPFIIMTPHPGEMARLAGLTIAEIEAERLETSVRFAARHNVYLVLKGARTIVAAPDGRTAINGSGNPGMASGGTGDVLTGVITALVAQGYEPFAACCLGVFCHGLAADMVAAVKGEIGMIATDIEAMLPHAFKRLAENGAG